MKKRSIVLLVGVFALIFLSTGCGSKEAKLVCTQTSSGVDITFNVDFKGNIIKAMDFGYDMDLSKYSDAQIKAIEKQDFCSSVKRSMSEYKDAFNNCEQSVKEKHLQVSAKFDVDKIAKNVLDKMTSPENAKKELEKENYKCTIK